MPCKGLCIKIRAEKRNYLWSTRYNNGQKWCKCCEAYMYADLWCPCCHKRIRQVNRYKYTLRWKKKNHMVKRKKTVVVDGFIHYAK